MDEELAENFFAVSAKSGENIPEMFEYLGKQILEGDN